MLSFFPSFDVQSQSGCNLVPGFFSLSGLFNPSLQYSSGGGISPPPRYRYIFSVSSGVRFAMVMISDDGDDQLTPLTFLWILPISLL